MKRKDKDFYSGKDEIELTDKLIYKLVKQKKWGSVEHLKELRDQGAKWNKKRNSIVFDIEFF